MTTAGTGAITCSTATAFSPESTTVADEPPDDDESSEESESSDDDESTDVPTSTGAGLCVCAYKTDDKKVF